MLRVKSLRHERFDVLTFWHSVCSRNEHGAMLFAQNASWLKPQGDTMANSTIIVYSPASRLDGRVPQTLRKQVDLQVFDSYDDVVPALNDARSATFVADLQQSGGGGHTETSFLERLLDLFPSIDIIMLTDDVCPEPLERLAACSTIRHLRGDSAIDELCEIFTPQQDVQADGGAGASEKTGTRKRETAPADEVLHSITTRFQTNTPQLHRMLMDLEVAAQHDVTVLLIGETGSGKTYLSKLIHEVSPRRDKPFMPVACGALPSELIESELFGHVKGAFTSAHADKEGKFLAAGQGTILLDEIDVLGPEQQVKLLRVIETGEFEPVGSNKTYTSQARLVVASNLDLQPLVEQGKFRPDLYYRLNMLKFEIPPLRARKPDVPIMAKLFIKQLAEKHKIAINDVDDALFEALYQYPWPGNVRELENVIQRAVIYCRDGVLTASHLPPHIVMGVAGPTNDPTVSLGNRGTAAKHLGSQIAVTERDIIEQALFKNNYSRTNTAKELGISRVTLYNKMKKYGMSK
jgi:DNA-binding NtrC family response regulator